MRRTGTFLLSFFMILQAFGQSGILGQLRGAEANKICPGAELVWKKQNNILPAFIQFREGQAPDAATFLAYLHKKFQLPAAYTFNPYKIENDPTGWRHIKYQLLVNGVPVLNGIFVLHLYNEKVYKYNGYIFNNINVPTVPTVNVTAGLNAALADVNAVTYKWQLPIEEEFLKQETGDPKATFYPKGQLFILQLGDNTSNNFRLVWRYDVYCHQPMERWYVYVDANEGRVLKKTSRICHADAQGTAVTAYRGTQTITTDSLGTTYRLREEGRGQGIRTRNMLKGTNYGNAVDFIDSNNIWNNVNANKDQYATDAHWGAEMTYDFYQEMGRNSIDDNGYPLNLYVHYNNNYVNAFWDGTRMTFGDGNANYSPLTSLDITGHEISHGLTERTSNLDYSNESGALNESFSDIFGQCVEWYADSTRFNWLVGEDIGNAFRSMSDPKSKGDPDTYQGQNWYGGTGDYGGVHTNSSVQNYWFYLLTEGGSGTNDLNNNYSVTGIGIEKAQQIAWRNLVYYLTNSSDYMDARFYSLQAANDIFGACSPEAISATKAWYAVGVGNDFVYGADAQFSLSPASGCTAPSVVTFNNLSSNGNTYTWYFGDGTSSTAINPSHTYTALGNYNAKLVVDGGACGTDSLEITNAVSLQSSNPCVVVMPQTGTYQLQTTCEGFVYDNGGPGDNYTDQTNSTVTIAPPGAASVTLNFLQFKMEDTYDYVYVYDGPNASGTVLGAFTGNALPPSITSTSPSVSIRMYSDFNVVDSGFIIQWTCNQPTGVPAANFKADVVTTCNGQVKFTDLTTGGVNSWHWDFGDGSTSTQQHPAHTYTVNGTYTVTLTATNSFGANVATKTAYITVNRPLAPVVEGDSSCGPAAFTAIANSTDSVRWYDANGSMVYNGNPFNTGMLNTTTTFYAEQTVAQPAFNVGPSTNTIGNGTNYNSNQTRALRFRVFKNCKLVSVLVYAQGDGYRTIQYRDSVGAVITEKTVFIPDGASRVTLNLDLIPGGAYELGLRDTMNLFRNSTGAVYPYNDANGMVSIFGNNAPNSATYYYFFYDWEVREQDCVSERTPVTFTIHTKPVVNATITDVSCNGLSDGEITVSSTSSPSVNYVWGSGVQQSIIPGLNAGTYTVTAQDVYGCSASAAYTVNEPAALTASTMALPDTCHRNVGSVAAQVTGGTTPYNYQWSNGNSLSFITQLAPGNFAVTVTDANGCTTTSSAGVGTDGSIGITPASANISCYGMNDGQAQVTVNTGHAPYAYNWNSGESTASITGKSQGNYTVSVTDALGCSATAAFTISEPAVLSVQLQVTEPTCYGLNNGSVTAMVSGGTTGYTYQWNTGEATDSLALVTAGYYTVTVSDANNCSFSSSIVVNEPVLLTANTISLNAKCYGEANGAATVSVSGGTQGYTFLWSNGSSAEMLSNIPAGNYSVTVTDAHNCSVVDVATITEPAEMQLTFTTINATDNQNNGSAAVTINGGTAPYAYLWSGSETTSTVNSLGAGTYQVTITDANGCVKTGVVTVANENTTGIKDPDGPVFMSVYPNPAKDKVNLTLNNAVGGFTYALHNALGQIVLQGESAAAFQVVSVSNLPNGVYMLQVGIGAQKLQQQLILTR
jgi:Zn-dependent metalloprotease